MDTTEEEWNKTIATNLKGSFLFQGSSSIYD